MIDKKSFESLLSFQSGGDNTISIYLKAKPGFINLKPLKVEYKNLIKSLPKKIQKALHKELNTISTLIQNTPPTGKDLAIFASHGRLNPYPLDANFPKNLIVAGNTYTLFPLYYAEQFTPTALVTMISKKEVQLFRIDTGVKRLLSIKRKDTARRDRFGFFGKGRFGSGGSTGEDRNRQGELTTFFFKDCADKVSKRIDDELGKINHQHIEIIIGEPQYSGLFAAKRPQTCREHISFLGSILGYTKENNLKKLAREIVRKQFRKNMSEVAKEAMAGGSKGGAVSATHALTALQEGKVKDFVLAINQKIPGTVCGHCGYALTASAKACPVCSGKTIFKSDITENIFRLAHKYSENVYLTSKKLPIQTPMLCTFRY